MSWRLLFSYTMTSAIIYVQQWSFHEQERRHSRLAGAHEITINTCAWFPRQEHLKYAEHLWAHIQSVHNRRHCIPSTHIITPWHRLNFEWVRKERKKQRNDFGCALMLTRTQKGIEQQRGSAYVSTIPIGVNTTPRKYQQNQKRRRRSRRVEEKKSYSNRCFKWYKFVPINVLQTNKIK